MYNQSLTSSRRCMPWDYKENLSPYEQFIKDQYLEVFDRRHQSLIESGEAEFLNAFQVFQCRHCGSENFIKYGHTVTSAFSALRIRKNSKSNPLISARVFTSLSLCQSGSSNFCGFPHLFVTGNISHGAEAPSVIIPVLNSQRYMLRRNLLYPE